MTELIAAVQSLSTAKDILHALHGLKVTGEVQAELNQLGDQLMNAQAAALEAQQRQQQMLQRLQRLEDQLQKYEDWEAEKKRYELVEIGGRFAYSLKEKEKEAQPKHLICPNCYEEKVRSILHLSANERNYGCHRCGLKILIPKDDAGLTDSEPVYVI